MPVIKCKMCGGDIKLSDDRTFGSCEYCGSVMTLPKIDSDQRAAAFNRGNHFRRIGEFDKALGIYEHIIQEDNTDAEAHWCCALCRFGIEYVEDPVTYEWIPTCHRASFDSFLEDVDYQAALEYSDGITRRQYQKDAAKIAEVQKGILAASQNEEPFDVFICYKESDENGNRTKDSTLAQDIYFQLTEQGLRVFFSRITLEDKAGSQYEPYIFAALNSARIMIVIGTKPEYFNAVWVKNEWSRFLALMKKDHSRLLLPCYRDMDPYDLPDQLSVLQSYDMSRIGFIQDLIRGVDKVLHAGNGTDLTKDNATVQQPRTSAIFLERGNMALEDGQWKRADGFFEEVLNQDIECAEAYAGKALAANQSENLEMYVRKALDKTQEAKSEKLEAVEFAKERRDTAITKYQIPKYLSAKQIAGVYTFDRTYFSCLAARKQQSKQAKQEFEESFARAFQFARGDYKAKLEGIRQKYFDSLDARIEEAQKEDEENISRIKEDYERHLDEADVKAEQLYQEAEGKREKDYQDLCLRQKKARGEKELLSLSKAFEELENYSDCRRRANACLRKIKQSGRISTLWAILLGLFYLGISAIPLILIEHSEGLQGKNEFLLSLFVALPAFIYVSLCGIVGRIRKDPNIPFSCIIFYFISIISDAIIFNVMIVSASLIWPVLLNKVLQGMLGFVILVFAIGLADFDSKPKK